MNFILHPSSFILADLSAGWILAGCLVWLLITWGIHYTAWQSGRLAGGEEGSSTGGNEGIMRQKEDNDFVRMLGQEELLVAAERLIDEWSSDGGSGTHFSIASRKRVMVNEDELKVILVVSRPYPKRALRAKLSPHSALVLPSE